jgi:hypothetical protein
MKKSIAFLSIIVILCLSACSGSKKGGGCDCPTFGTVDVNMQENFEIQHT